MQVIFVLYTIILWYIVLLDFCYISLLFASLKGIFISYLESKTSELMPAINKIHLLQPVTVLIPVYNGCDLILESIYSVLNSKDHDQISIIIINDGSTDATLYTLNQEFKLYEIQSTLKKIVPIRKSIKKIFRSKTIKNIIVIDKVNGGKSDAINAGLNVCRTNFFITLDHDTLVAPNAIYTLMNDFLRERNSVAIGGCVSVLNGCKYNKGKIVKESVSSNPICAIQSIEYLRSFLYGREGWDVIGGSLCYSGAFTLFKTDNVVEAGGFDYQNVAQDFEIITHLQEQSKRRKYKSRLAFAPGAVAWTYVPNTFKSYWNQRTNWHMGSLQSLLRHKQLLFNPKYGIIGLITYPFFLFGEILSSFVIVFGYIISAIAALFGFINLYWVGVIFLVSLGLGLSLSFATFFLSLITYNRYNGFRNKLYLFIAAILENFGFRQYLVICEAQAILRYIFGKRPKPTFYH